MKRAQQRHLPRPESPSQQRWCFLSALQVSEQCARDIQDAGRSDLHVSGELGTSRQASLPGGTARTKVSGDHL